MTSLQNITDLAEQRPASRRALLITIPEAADLLAVSRGTLYQLTS
jgi:predicted DNA-binding transcriptional regulator AlpA